MALLTRAQRLRLIGKLHAQEAERSWQVSDLLFQRQLEVLGLVRQSRFHGICCPRRAGKTNFVVALLFDYALRTGLDVVYVGLTTKSAKATVWAPPKGLGILSLAEDIAPDGIDRGSLTVTLPNGAHIYVRGILDERAAARFRGQSYALVVVDECQDHGPQLLGPFVDAVIRPTLADNGGALFLVGTPGEFCSGLFWEVVEAGRHPEYQVHKWSWEDNPYTCDAVRGDAETRRQKYGDEDPTYLREYRGVWVADRSSLCLPNFSRANEYDPDELPPLANLLTVSIGIDIGGGGPGDPCAVCAWATFAADPRKWLVFEREITDPLGKLTDRDYLEAAEEAARRFPRVIAAHIDSTVAVAPSRDRPFAILPARKVEKAQQLRVMDDDCKAGVMMVPRGGPFSQQARSVYWDKAELARHKKVPTNKVPNDVMDAGQYGYLSVINMEELPPPPKTLDERMREETIARGRAQNEARDWQERLLSGQQ